MGVFRRLIGASRGARHLWLGGAGLGLLALLANFGLLATAAWFLTRAAEVGLAPPAAQNAFNLYLPSAGVRFFAMLRVLARYGARLLDHEASLKFLALFRPALLRRLIPRVPFPEHGPGAGDVMGRLLADLERMEGALTRVLTPAALFAAGSLLILAFWLLLAPPAPALALAAGLGLAALGVMGAAWRTERRERARLDAEGELRALFVEAGEGVEEVLTGEGVEGFTARLAAPLAAWEGAERARAGRETAARLIATAAAQGAVLAVFAAGFALHRAGALSAPLLALFTLSALAAFEIDLAALALTAAEARAAARRVFALTDPPPRITDPPHPAPPPTRHDLRLEGVWARHEPAGQWVLRDVSLRLEEGARVVVLGPSGAGKSSLAQLLVRFLPYERGTARLGGTELAALSGETVRRLVTYIPERPHLFARTLAEQLRLTRAEATPGEMWAALEAAGLAARFRDEGGLETWLGPEGVRLSGGERRRLALAQGLLRATPWLILDEPTAHLDPETAHALGETLAALRPAGGLILITHDPGLIRPGDCVVRIEAGTIAAITRAPSSAPTASAPTASAPPAAPA
jgi:ATP-binding cassette subfamily C protein CydC